MNPPDDRRGPGAGPRCPRCHWEIAPGARDCAACHAPLGGDGRGTPSAPLLPARRAASGGLVCPRCFAESPEGLAVCGHCGGALLAPDRPGRDVAALARFLRGK